MWREELKPVGQLDRPNKVWRISLVYRGSPAEKSGIRAGWGLLSIDGASVSPKLLFRARRNGNAKLRFIDKDGKIYLWQGRHFPFGIHTSPPLSPMFQRRVARLRLSDEDRATLIDLFALGDLKAFESLIPDFQTALGIKQPFFARIGLSKPKSSADIPESDNHEYLDFLSLGFIAAENLPLAKLANIQAKAARDRVGQRSYSSNTLAINGFVRTHLAIAAGETDRALEAARQAWEFHPDYSSLRNLFWTLSGKQPIPATDIQLGSPFPIEYNLPNHDPVDELPVNHWPVGLKNALASMSDGQVLIIILYGNYRSNYYGNIDLERLALMYPACHEVIAGVHIICSSDYALSAGHRHEVEGLAQQQGLPMAILWDEDNSLMNKLGHGSSPIRCVLDKSGTILSTAPLAQEKGLWEALQSLQQQSNFH